MGGKTDMTSVMDRFKKLYDTNEPKNGGSFYLQSSKSLFPMYPFTEIDKPLAPPSPAGLRSLTEVQRSCARENVSKWKSGTPSEKQLSTKR